MPMIDYFNTTTGIFSPRSLTDTIQKAKYRPRLLGQLGMFVNVPINTIGISIEEIAKTNKLIPIQTTAGRGARAQQASRNMRSMRAINSLHMKQEDRVAADEVPVRAMGSETAIETLAMKVSQKTDDMREKFEANFEYLRMNALLGLVKDDTGATVLNMFNEFGKPASNGSSTVTPLTQTTQALGTGTSTTDVRNSFIIVKRDIEDVLGFTCTQGIAMVGRTMFDAIVSHPTVAKLWDTAQSLLAIKGYTDYRATGFDLGGVHIYEYRGGTTYTLADGTTAAFAGVADNEGYCWDAQSDQFRCYLAPNDTLDGFAAGAMGSEFYGYSVVEPEQTGIRIIGQSNPLFLNLRPDAVIKLTL